MKPPFGSRAIIEDYVPSWKAQVRRKGLRLPELVLDLARRQVGWFSIVDIADGATGALDVEHYRDKHAQRRVVAVHLLKLHRAGHLERQDGPGRAARYRMRESPPDTACVDLRPA